MNTRPAILRPLSRLLAAVFLLSAIPSFAAEKVDGYRGIWFTLGQMGKQGDKYSGGLGTYTSNHVPIAIYSAKAHKTFFVYGGSRDGNRHLLCMASYYDHATGKLPTPNSMPMAIR